MDIEDRVARGSAWCRSIGTVREHASGGYSARCVGCEGDGAKIVRKGSTRGFRDEGRRKQLPLRCPAANSRCWRLGPGDDGVRQSC